MIGVQKQSPGFLVSGKVYQTCSIHIFQTRSLRFCMHHYIDHHSLQIQTHYFKDNHTKGNTMSVEFRLLVFH
jgi:hypothetical protein